MFMSKNNYLCVALLAAAIVILAVGCSNNENSTINTSNISAETITTEQPSEAPPSDEPEVSDEPSAAIDPTAAAEPTAVPETEKPKATQEPVTGSGHEAAPTAKPTKKPTQTLKPSATVKPPVIVLPSSTPKPTPTPSAKPTATPQPSMLPIATTSPSPKPTAELGDEDSSSEVTTASIAAKLEADSGLGPLLAVEGEQIKEIFGIDPETQLIAGSFYQPKMMIQAGEFSVVQLKSDTSFSDIEAAFKQRAETVQKAYEAYLQDQYEQATNYQIIRNGDFVLFSISPDQKKTADIFNSFFAK
ncbi:hypothetical protein BK133_17570 [Paenibacillus sp. FSL H8-0548]|nr:hypothetical protein BK133_17570 [Paenibacillus sp. FSL H8-0548]